MLIHHEKVQYSNQAFNQWVNTNATECSLIKDGVSKQYKIHRLVATAFIPNPLNKPQVNHIDNNPLNNKVENLEWVTNAENVRWCASQGRLNRGENNAASRLKEHQVLKIRELHASNKMAPIDIKRKYKISSSHFRDIIDRETWKHL